jgi:hypothetical protein
MSNIFVRLTLALLAGAIMVGTGVALILGVN